MGHHDKAREISAPVSALLSCFKFRLYVADGTLNSGLAVDNLRQMCGAHLAGRHHIELIDVFKNPDRALKDRVFMTPTLVKVSPGTIGG